MLDVASEFDLADDRVWLNAAHQGPLPSSGSSNATATYSVLRRSLESAQSSNRFGHQSIGGVDANSRASGAVPERLARLLAVRNDIRIARCRNSGGYFL